MSDDNFRRGLWKLFKNFLEQLLRNGINIRCSFVQNKQCRRAEYRAHERDELLLSERDTIACRNNVRIQSLIESLYERQQILFRKYCFQFFVRKRIQFRISIRNIFTYRAA